MSTCDLWLAYSRWHPPRQAGHPIWRLAVRSRERGRGRIQLAAGRSAGCGTLHPTYPQRL